MQAPSIIVIAGVVAHTHRQDACETSDPSPDGLPILPVLFTPRFSASLMSKSFFAVSRRTRPYPGSALLESGAARCGRVLVVVVLMWLLTGWALDWW